MGQIYRGGELIDVGVCSAHAQKHCSLYSFFIAQHWERGKKSKDSNSAPHVNSFKLFDQLPDNFFSSFQSRTSAGKQRRDPPRSRERRSGLKSSDLGRAHLNTEGLRRQNSSRIPSPLPKD